MLTLAFLAVRLLTAAIVAPPPSGAALVRATVADGSVWADVVRGGDVVATYRLRAATSRTRWLALDIDGDGRVDLVGVDGRGFGTRIEIWRATDDGFVAAVPSG